MSEKTRASRDLLILSVLTLVTILTWVGMDVYRRLTKPPIPEILEKELLPLDPQIETDVFDVLETRLKDIPYSPPSPTIVEEPNQSSPSAESEQGEQAGISE